MKVINNNVFVTRDGNICEKSRKGRRIGTYAGVAAAVAYDLFPRNSSIRNAIGTKSSIKCYAKIVKGGKEIFGKMATVNSIAAENLANMSKGGRLALVATSLLSIIGLSALVGRGIGKIVDKIIDRRHAKQVDAQI